MQYQVSFGALGARPRAAAAGQKFRLAVLADLSGRANAGRCDTGAALAARKPIKVDVDSLDAAIARQHLTLSLKLADAEAQVRVPIGEIEDFHPDQLAEKSALFAELLTLRRDLQSRSGFARAAQQVLAWGGAAPLPPPPRGARGAVIATDQRLGDFARLTGRPPPATATPAAPVEALLRRLVGPFIVPARDAQQPALLARVDAALTDAMRRVLHHPDFQAAEAIWRGIEMLVRRIETDARLEIVLYDVSAEEFAADLAAGEQLADSGLYGLLVERPAQDAQQGALSAIIGLYDFALIPPHADLLGRAAQIAAAARAPFLAGIGPDALRVPPHEQHPLIQQAFAALRALPEAAYLGLVAPRFLLRLPYGRKTDPIEAFGFEEFSRQGGLGAMLFGHPALLPALLLAQTWTRQGAKMQPGTLLGVGEMPYYVYTDPDGEPIALPCTERLFSERDAARVASHGVMPLLSLRGRPEVRLGGFAAVAGGKLAGFWHTPPLPPAAAPAAAPVAAPVAAPAPAAAPVVESPVAEAAVAEAAVAASAPEIAPVASPPPASAPIASTPTEDDLDRLLASLNAEAPAAADNATEADLDALLAALQ